VSVGIPPYPVRLAREGLSKAKCPVSSTLFKFLV